MFSDAFEALKADLDANIIAVTAAIDALGKGMAGGFLRKAAAQVLRKLIHIKQSMLDTDRQETFLFILNKEDSEYTPQSDEITGILKEMGDDMSKDLTIVTGTLRS